MVLNLREEEGYHYIVNLLGKLIVLPVLTSEIPPLLPAWVGGAVIRTTLYLIFIMLSFYRLHDLTYLKLCELLHSVAINIELPPHTSPNRQSGDSIDFSRVQKKSRWQ